MRGALRQVGVALVLGVVAGLVVGAISSSRSETYAATARLSLTEEVVWPFFDAVREEQQVRLEDRTLRLDLNDDTRAATGGDIVDLRLALPKAQTFLELEAIATTAEAAAFAANAAADRIIAADRAAGLAPIVDEIELVEQALRAIGGGGEASSIQRGTQQSRLIDLERARDAYRPRVALIREATAPEASQRNALADGLIAAMLFGALVLAALRTLVYRRGSVGSPQAAAEMAGVGMLGRFHDDADLLLAGGAGSVRNFFLHLRGVLAIVPVPGTGGVAVDGGRLAEQLAEALAREGRTVTVLSDRPGLTGPEDCLRRAERLEAGEVLHVTLADVAYEDFTDAAFPAWLRDLTGCVDAVLCVVDTTDRGDLLARHASTIVHVGAPDLARTYWRSLESAFQGYDGQRLVAFARPGRDDDLRSASATITPSVRTA